MKKLYFLAASFFLILSFISDLCQAQLTRAQIISDANAYINYTWTCYSNNRLTSGYYCSSVGRSIYPASCWVVVGSNTSMPYCWGGWSTSYQHTTQMTTSTNTQAGDVCSANCGGGCSGNYAGLSCASGHDCSGLISRVWGLSSKYSTSTLPNISTLISSSSAQPGDILNNAGSHVMLVETNNGNGYFQVIEASGIDWKVVSHSKTPSQLTGFVPRCWNSVIGGCGTSEFLDCSSTITLSCGVPYNGTTVGGNSDAITNSCNSWTDTGPERVHFINTTAAGNLTATLSNLGGVDLDVYILGSCNTHDCYGTVTSNSDTYLNAPAGAYIILVDGYNGASGSYTLTVNCAGTLPDLLISSGTQSASPTTVVAGSNITAYSSEDNSGTSTSGSNLVSLWLSADATLNTSSDVFLGNINGFPSLSAGSNSNILNSSVNIPSNTAAGSYYLFFWADGNCSVGSTCSSCSGVVAESNECNNFASCVINVTCNAPSPAASITGNSSVCAGSPLVLTANGSLTSGATWKWYSDNCGGTFVGSGSPITVYPSSNITYYLRAESACGNSICVSKSITINTIPNSPNPTISANPVCPGTNVTLYANTTASSYSWSGPNGYSSASQNPSFTANSNSAGQYSLVVTQNGCQSPAGYTAYLSLNPSPTLAFSPSSPNFCQGHGPVNVAAMGASSYTWSPSTGLSSTTIPNPNANPGNTTIYTVTGTLNGCTGLSTVTVTVNPPAQIYVSPQNPSFCIGTSGVQLTATGGNGNNYMWLPSTGLNNPYISNPVANPNTNTTYSVTGTNVNGCTGSNTVNVTTQTPPTINLIPPSPSICVGGSISISATGANTYTWAPSTGLNTTSGSTVIAGPTSLGTHTYTVTGTDAYGCTNMNTVTVIVTNSPTVTISANIPPPYCQGQTQAIVLSPSTTGSSYLWAPGYQTTSSINVTSSGIYTVSVTNPPGCTGTYTSAPFTVTINQNPTVPVITVTPNPACAGQGVSFSTASPGPYYNWTGPNGFNYSIQNPPTISAVGLINMGNYNLTVTNNEGCSSVSNTINLVIKDTNVAITGNTQICSGQFDTLTATQGASYLWSSGNQTTQAIIINIGGPYFVTVTNPNFCNGTTKSASINVTSSPSPPIPSITITNAGGGHVNLVASLLTGYDYQWYLNMTGLIQPISGAIGNILFNADSCGYYLIRITDVISGCSSESGLIYCPVGINEIGNSGNFIIYPNPTNDELNIKGDNIRNGNYEILLSNIIGQQLEKKTVKVTDHLLEYKFIIKDFSSGMYFLNLKSEKIYKTFSVEKF